jgi:hypothetical protein
MSKRVRLGVEEGEEVELEFEGIEEEVFEAMVPKERQ